ncbi:hypothetical protein GPALN_001854 [Globodera pallida]|nr:hypothetical protein GPALN_001854 [Globodera pallida]
MVYVRDTLRRLVYNLLVGLGDTLQDELNAATMANGDRMPQLIERALGKHLLDSSDSSNYCLPTSGGGADFAADKGVEQISDVGFSTRSEDDRGGTMAERVTNTPKRTGGKAEAACNEDAVEEGHVATTSRSSSCPKKLTKKLRVQNANGVSIVDANEKGTNAESIVDTNELGVRLLDSCLLFECLQQAEADDQLQWVGGSRQKMTELIKMSWKIKWEELDEGGDCRRQKKRSGSRTVGCKVGPVGRHRAVRALQQPGVRRLGQGTIKWEELDGEDCRREKKKKRQQNSSAAKFARSDAIEQSEALLRCNSRMAVGSDSLCVV